MHTPEPLATPTPVEDPGTGAGFGAAGSPEPAWARLERRVAELEEAATGEEKQRRLIGSLPSSLGDSDPQKLFLGLKIFSTVNSL